ncbi:3-deoxy-D-manno-octulosonate 8-phosphate phosphatase (KDO 8-P phosphatase) [Sporomusaceae bacterium BoRhaA]|uniref:KdsC family phosphatase n=1 Tax=Pelorhabdus rhamnosifermentans TaxID=2772457 RepID=UPI001FE813D4|nr:HAD hydrolase family protein [Pelorhabdus rhamnosifermentans]MBU2698990.1 3-deoxy-D-manno-octulosonate 8-phosphate phosphatase (KDO 8-P phosphatase) [Pelorhabdus rhamnosifermentans]
MTLKTSLSLEERAQSVRMIVFDVDGVLTDGQMFFSRDGEALKAFHVRDGLAISLAQRAGLGVAIITARQSEMVRLRGAELKIGDIYQGSPDKVVSMQALIEKHQLDLSQICYIGDDLNDLPLLINVGLACTVANGAEEVQAVSHFVADKPGGQGAVRQIIEMILKSQGKWEDLVAAYRRPGCIGLCQ